MLVDQDECWFSRFAQPQMHAFAADTENLRLVQREPERGEADKAIACYGAVCDQTDERFLHRELSTCSLKGSMVNRPKTIPRINIGAVVKSNHTTVIKSFMIAPGKLAKFLKEVVVV